MQQEIFVIISVLVLLALSGLYSMGETAITGADLTRLYALRKTNRKKFQRIYDLLKRKEEMLSIVLIGNNLCNIFASTITAALLVRWLGEGKGVAAASLTMAFLVLIFAEVLPKTYAILHANTFIRILHPFLSFSRVVFFPIAVFMRGCIVVARSILPAGRQKKMDPHEEIKGLLNFRHAEGEIIKKDKDMISGILSLRELTVEEIMIHRKNVYALNVEDPVSDLIEVIVRNEHSRIPFWKENPENIIGILHVRDLFLELARNHYDYEGFSIASVLRPAWYIPEYTRAEEQLHAFLHEKNHCALVVDEYGAWMGLITLEDLLEEIVGDITDEYDRSSTGGIEEREDGTYVIAGNTHIRDINRHLDLELPDDHATTLAGLLMHSSHSIPTKEDIFVFGKFGFKVLEKNKNQIISILMWPMENQEKDSPASPRE